MDPNSRYGWSQSFCFKTPRHSNKASTSDVGDEQASDLRGVEPLTKLPLLLAAVFHFFLWHLSEEDRISWSHVCAKMADAHLDANDFYKMGSRIARYKLSRSENVSQRRFKAHFGTPSDVAACTWELMTEAKFLRDALGSSKPNPDHMMWSLMLLKMYPTMPAMASTLQVDETTVRKWCLLYLEAMAELDRQLVSTIQKKP